MELKESDSKLATLCREFEGLTDAVEQLKAAELQVVLLPDFAQEPEAAQSNVIRNTSAAYRRSLRSVIVNDSEFWNLDEDVRLAVLAHEVGHAICHRDGLIEAPRFEWLHECQVADLLACRWGFHAALRKERMASYGSRYCDILDQWEDEESYVTNMARWRQQHLAGLKL